jgi:hydroxymethylpyrimidine/phosphomethylpyrimidine kinase
MLFVGKTTTTSNTTQGPSRVFHGIHQGENIFNRSHRLLAAKSTSLTAMAAAMQSVKNVMDEITLNHKAFCTQWGVSEKELEETPESTATTAYGAYIMDIGFQGDSVKLNMALAACLLGYGEVGLWLVNEANHPGSWVTMNESSNPYVPWIREYSGEMYQKAVETGLGGLRVSSSTVSTKRGRYDSDN